MEPRTDYSITKTFDSCSPNLIHHEPPSAPHHEDPCVVWKLSSKLYLPVKLLLYKGVHTDHFFSSGPDSFLIQNSLCAYKCLPHATFLCAPTACYAQITWQRGETDFMLPASHTSTNVSCIQDPV